MKQVRTQWNTGAWYTTEGQIIVAVWLPNDCVIAFQDHSRNIAGVIPMVNLHWNPSPEEVQRRTLGDYNIGNYHGASVFRGDVEYRDYAGTQRMLKCDLSRTQEVES